MKNYEESKIWKTLKENCKDDMEIVRIQSMCNSAIELTKTVRDTFPAYTLHDERHICNVVEWMEQILGDSGVKILSVGECALLLLAACYHDIGMCYTEEQRNRELKSARFVEYLETNPRAFLAVETCKESGNEIPENVQSDYFRKIHHLRVSELLPATWEIKSVRKDRLIQVCKSHGEKLEDALEGLQYDKFLETDYVLCAVLLRLADILDFDISRAPYILYEYQKINKAADFRSDIEWKKHQASKGFKFIDGVERVLAYGATCENMQDEYEIRKFLDYIDEELAHCSCKLAEYGQDKWKTLEIPIKIDRNIESLGYQMGEYCLTLEADSVLELLVGNDLYNEDSTFVRELLQNSLDAVCARKAVDQRWNQEEKEQIVLSSWIDQDSFQWFRIDDAGIGMTEDMILNYFLRVGRSYYQSDEFKKKSYDNKRFYEFTPISQFGIGILSCFLKGDRMEVSTRHYNAGNGIRFTMNGIKGYYSIAVEEKGDRGTPMPGVMVSDNFLQRAGTAIAIRIKESLTQDIEESIKKYLCYPQIPVCYKDEFKAISFPTEQELMDFAKANRQIKIPFPIDFMNRFREVMPEINWEELPYVCLNCIPLDEILESSFISGVEFEIDIVGKHNGSQQIVFGEITVERELEANIAITRNCISIRFFYEFRCLEQGHRIDWSEMEERYRNKGKDTSVVQDLMEKDKIYVECNIPFSVNEALKTAMEKFIIPRCDRGTKNIENHKVEKVYNGICVETTWEDYDPLENRNFKYTVVLLSKDFQPKLGISREQVRYFPVKAAGYIELLGKRIGNYGLACKYFSYYENMEYGNFDELINDSKFCALAEETLEVRYGVNLKSLKEKFLLSAGKEVIHVSDFENIFSHYFHNLDFYFTDILLKVLLQKEFEIRWEFNELQNEDYFITGIRKNKVLKAEKLFLPMTFVASLNKNTEVLTKSRRMGRIALNADHPFAVWLINHADVLYQKHKTLWVKLRRDICNLDSMYMIVEVNNFLKEIERRERISIPDNVWLKESDFYGDWC